MPKGEIRIVHVPRWMTLFAWIAVSAAMAASEYLLSGRAYAWQASVSSLIASIRRSTSTTSVLAVMAPAAADALFFVPWGALAFLSIDSDRRSRATTYSVTIALGVAFALALVAWQYMLPTRILRGIDTLWNIAGCAIGATLGHARKRVRIRFE